jgi:hypothetical protein
VDQNLIFYLVGKLFLESNIKIGEQERLLQSLNQNNQRLVEENQALKAQLQNNGQ